MPTLQQMLCAALAAGCVSSALPAEARGRSRTNSVHGASAVGQGGGSGSSSSKPRASGGTRDRGPRRTGLFRPWGVAGAGVAGGGVAYRPDPWRSQERDPEDDEPPHPLMVRRGGEGGSGSRGGVLGVGLGIEGRRWGMSTRLTSLTVDGTSTWDRLALGEANVTYSPVSNQKGRLRLEGGLAVTRAPGATFIGPSLAASFERCLMGALDLEGRVQFVPMPQLQLDAQLALAVHLGMMSFRFGWRGVAFNDLARVDGTLHRDTVGGPFGGLGLSF